MVSKSSQTFFTSDADSVQSFIKYVDNETENVSKSTTEKKNSGKKITTEVDENDSSLEGKEKEEKEVMLSSPGSDPRFQQQNQTLRCYVMYTDFYRCENILGEGHEACAWFKRVFQSICPNDWIREWDDIRVTGRLPWHKSKTQGNFPGSKYGVR